MKKIKKGLGTRGSYCTLEKMFEAAKELAKEFDVSQSALARYEIDDSTPSPEVFLKYADYFDVSLDYIFGRTDDPHGMIYNNCVKLGLNNPEMARFVEMCFDPGSAMNERLKATLVQMLSEVDAK